LVATSDVVTVQHERHRQSNPSTSSADDVRSYKDDAEENTEDNFKRYEHIRRTLSHSRRRYSTIKRKYRANKDAIKKANEENTIVASGSHDDSSLPRTKLDDLETSLSLDRNISAEADREMAELSGKDEKEADLDDSLKASKTFSSLKRGVYC